MGGFDAAFIAFMAASIALVGLVFTTAFMVARAQDHTIDRMKAQAPRVKRWGGWILTTVGLWFLVLALFAESFSGVFSV